MVPLGASYVLVVAWRTDTVKVIFLDFDGVLNSGPYTDSLKQKVNFKPRELSMDWWAEGLDPVCVKLLNKLVERTGAVIVVTSTWRLHATLGWLQRVLRMRGFEHRVYGATERHVGQARSYEIQRWLGTKRLEQFVILDDDDKANIAGHFVKTDPEVGLTVGLVEKAVKILSESQGKN
jgi:hypothetical protein